MRRSRLVLAMAAVTVGALATALPVAGAPAKAVASPAAADAGAVTRVTVRMGEFWLKLSKKSAPRGTVIFTVINTGAIAHDFDFVRGIKKSMPVIGPRKRFTYRLTFRKKGRYGYICTVPRHAQLGMAGTFVIR